MLCSALGSDSSRTLYNSIKVPNDVIYIDQLMMTIDITMKRLS